MKNKTYTLYDSYYSLEKKEATRDFLFELYADEEGWETADDIPDSRVFEEMDFEDDISWQNIKHELDVVLGKDCYLLTGYCGTWRGNLEGGSFIRSLSDLSRTIEHLDDIKIIDRNGHLIIEGSHHDGSDCYELKRLTHKGYLLADRNYFAKDRDLHKTIMNNNFFSALPHFAERIYGV